MKRSQGFTLIEVMVVVAIIGILSAIAIPQYNDYLTRSRIPQAVSTLSGAKVRMEQFFQDNRFYNSDGSTSATCGFTLPNTTNFSYTCVASNNGQAYVWTATGIDPGPMKGFSFTINQVNARTSTIAAGAVWPAATSGCWITNKGSC